MTPIAGLAGVAPIGRTGSSARAAADEAVSSFRIDGSNSTVYADTRVQSPQ